MKMGLRYVKTVIARLIPSIPEFLTKKLNLLPESVLCSRDSQTTVQELIKADLLVFRFIGSVTRERERESEVL